MTPEELKAEWRTPAEYLNAARAVMGGIDLDPASTAAANGLVKARRFFTKQQDGLARKWRGRVWLNPPYSPAELCTAFIDKLRDEWNAGHIEQFCLLVNSWTDTQRFRDLVADRPDYVVGFPPRIHFLDIDGKPQKQTRERQMFVYRGPNPKQFHRVFVRFGPILRGW